MEIGRTVWAIPEGYIPDWSNGYEPEMTSHESVSVLNATDDEAHVRITCFFGDREPVGPFELTVPPRRTRHVRFNELDEPEPLPTATHYSTVVESDVPIVVQQTRLDSRQSENALLSTLGYAD